MYGIGRFTIAEMLTEKVSYTVLTWMHISNKRECTSLSTILLDKITSLNRWSRNQQRTGTTVTKYCP